MMTNDYDDEDDWTEDMDLSRPDDYVDQKKPSPDRINTLACDGFPAFDDEHSVSLLFMMTTASSF